MHTHRMISPTSDEVSDGEGNWQVISTAIFGSFFVIALALFILKCALTACSCKNYKRNEVRHKIFNSDINYVTAVDNPVNPVQNPSNIVKDVSSTEGNTSGAVDNPCSASALSEMQNLSEDQMTRLVRRNTIRIRLHEREMQKLRQNLQQEDYLIQEHLKILKSERAQIKVAKEFYEERIDSIPLVQAISTPIKVSSKELDQSNEQIEIASTEKYVEIRSIPILSSVDSRSSGVINETCSSAQYDQNFQQEYFKLIRTKNVLMKLFENYLLQEDSPSDGGIVQKPPHYYTDTRSLRIVSGINFRRNWNIARSLIDSLIEQKMRSSRQQKIFETEL